MQGPGLAQKLGWNAARTEPYDSHYSNCAVCRYTVLSYKRFIYTAGLLGVCNPGRCWCWPAPSVGKHQLQVLAPGPEDSKRLRWQAWCWQASTNSLRQLPVQALPKPTSRSILQPALSFTPTALIQ